MVAKVRTNDFLYDQNRGNTQAFFYRFQGVRLSQIDSVALRVFLKEFFFNSNISLQICEFSSKFIKKSYISFVIKNQLELALNCQHFFRFFLLKTQVDSNTLSFLFKMALEFFFWRQRFFEFFGP